MVSHETAKVASSVVRGAGINGGYLVVVWKCRLKLSEWRDSPRSCLLGAMVG